MQAKLIEDQRRLSTTGTLLIIAAVAQASLSMLAFVAGFFVGTLDFFSQRFSGTSEEDVVYSETTTVLMTRFLSGFVLVVVAVIAGILVLRNRRSALYPLAAVIAVCFYLAWHRFSYSQFELAGIYAVVGSYFAVFLGTCWNKKQLPEVENQAEST